jgi:hypothetical protein
MQLGMLYKVEFYNIVRGIISALVAWHNVMLVFHSKTFAEVLGDRETSAEKTGQPV